MTIAVNYKLSTKLEDLKVLEYRDGIQAKVGRAGNSFYVSGLIFDESRYTEKTARSYAQKHYKNLYTDGEQIVFRLSDNILLKHKDGQETVCFLSELELGDDDPDKNLGIGHTVLYQGKFTHPWSGDFTLSKKVMDKFVENFQAKVTKRDLFVNYNHEIFGKAAGWFKDIRREGTKLKADIDWTPSGAEAIRNKEFRYFSSEFTTLWTNSETGEEHENVFTGGALTNNPFLRNTEVVLHDLEISREEITMNKAEMIAALADEYSIDVVALQEKAQKLEAANQSLTEVKAELEGVKQSLKDIEEKALNDQVEVILDELVSKGKSTKALNDKIYRDLFRAKGVEEAKKLADDLAVIVKLEPKGTPQGEDADEEARFEDEVHAKAQKLMEQNKDMSYSDAVNAVLK